jgi:hypothetical protein
MRLQSLFRRRPTASMVVSVIALFVALGGVGYAAVSVPNNSVGTPQLKNGAVSTSKIKNNAVTYKQIEQHTIGKQRINTGVVQVRVSGACSGNSAINAVAESGKVTCHSTLPAQFGASSDSTTVGTTSTTVVSKLLPGGTYLLNANPYATINPAASAPAGQRVQVTCTLSAASGSSQTRSVSVASGGTNAPIRQVAIPMTFPATVASPQGTAHVDCVHTTSGPATPDAAVTVQSTLNAIATASNN